MFFITPAPNSPPHIIHCSSFHVLFRYPNVRRTARLEAFVSCDCGFPGSLGLLCLVSTGWLVGYEILWIIEILHDPKYLIPWEDWDYSILKSCRIFNINNSGQEHGNYYTVYSRGLYRLLEGSIPHSPPRSSKFSGFSKFSV